jgi:hypothetical protein
VSDAPPLVIGGYQVLQGPIRRGGSPKSVLSRCGLFQDGPGQLGEETDLAALVGLGGDGLDGLPFE